MSRSGYSDDCWNEGLGWLYRQAVENSINGIRGQKFLRELIETLDAMPKKELVSGEFVTEEGECCALGSVAIRREWEDPEFINSENHGRLGKDFDIAPCLVAEVEYINDDEDYWRESPSERWSRVRRWAVQQLKES